MDRNMWLSFLDGLSGAGLLYGWRRPGAPTQLLADPEPEEYLEPEVDRTDTP